MKLTNNQRLILEDLQSRIATTREIMLSLGYPHTYDSVHGSLRRLEDRFLVRRISDTPNKWELTYDGRRMLNP